MPSPWASILEILERQGILAFRDQGETQPAKPAHGSGPFSQCEPFREIVIGGLEQGLSHQRIWQDLWFDHGFAGSYYSVKRFARRLSQTSVPPFRRMETPPGEQAQIDFGKGAPVIIPDGEALPAGVKTRRRKTNLFRIVLIHSRKAYSKRPCKSRPGNKLGRLLDASCSQRQHTRKRIRSSALERKHALDGPQAVGDLLRNRRMKVLTKGLREMAKLLEVAPAHLTDLEKGRRTPSEELLVRISKHYGIDEVQLRASWSKADTIVGEVATQDATAAAKVPELLRTARKFTPKQWDALIEQVKRMSSGKG